jgi:hypothetical protein
MSLLSVAPSHNLPQLRQQPKPEQAEVRLILKRGKMEKISKRLFCKDMRGLLTEWTGEAQEFHSSSSISL